MRFVPKIVSPSFLASLPGFVADAICNILGLCFCATLNFAAFCPLPQLRRTGRGCLFVCLCHELGAFFGPDTEQKERRGWEES